LCIKPALGLLLFLLAILNSLSILCES